jgi:hypothetical protein
VTSAAFQTGTLSYSKARSISRIATPHNEQKLVDYAFTANAKQVDQHCRDLRNVHKALSTPDANRSHKNRYLSRTFHADGTMTLSVELPQEQGELVMKALEYAMGNMEASGGPEVVRDEGEDDIGVDYGDALEKAYSMKGSQKENGDSLFQRQADALVKMAQGCLAGGKDKTSCTADPRTKKAIRFTWAGSTGWCNRLYEEHLMRGTSAVGSPAALTRNGWTPTTWCIGPKGAKPASITVYCSAPPIIGCCTRVVSG